jgi:hypothetical protein
MSGYRHETLRVGTLPDMAIAASDDLETLALATVYRRAIDASCSAQPSA